MTEEFVQIAVVNYLKYQYPNALYCASAGGVRTSIKQAIKMKRTGYVKGFPDLFIYESSISRKMKQDDESFNDQYNHHRAINRT